LNEEGGEKEPKRVVESSFFLEEKRLLFVPACGCPQSAREELRFEIGEFFPEFFFFFRKIFCFF
tara:strand:- start:2180 stop:2371 length:192 start_codon:yes stop_codon:yes gene_type:complete